MGLELNRSAVCVKHQRSSAPDAAQPLPRSSTKIAKTTPCKVECLDHPIPPLAFAHGKSGTLKRDRGLFKYFREQRLRGADRAPADQQRDQRAP
jgi:hypothetical protein